MPQTNIEKEAIRLAYLTISLEKSALESAWECGKLLIEIKSSLKHGEFLPWILANMPIGKRQCRHYMTMARHEKSVILGYRTIRNAVKAIRDNNEINNQLEQQPMKKRPENKPYQRVTIIPNTNPNLVCLSPYIQEGEPLPYESNNLGPIIAWRVVEMFNFESDNGEAEYMHPDIFPVCFPNNSNEIYQDSVGCVENMVQFYVVDTVTGSWYSSREADGTKHGIEKTQQGINGPRLSLAGIRAHYTAYYENLKRAVAEHADA